MQLQSPEWWDLIHCSMVSSNSIAEQGYLLLGRIYRLPAAPAGAAEGHRQWICSKFSAALHCFPENFLVSRANFLFSPLCCHVCILHISLSCSLILICFFFSFHWLSSMPTLCYSSFPYLTFGPTYLSLGFLGSHLPTPALCHLLLLAACVFLSHRRRLVCFFFIPIFVDLWASLSAMGKSAVTAGCCWRAPAKELNSYFCLDALSERHPSFCHSV